MRQHCQGQRISAGHCCHVCLTLIFQPVETFGFLESVLSAALSSCLLYTGSCTTKIGCQLTEMCTVPALCMILMLHHAASAAVRLQS